jgi:N4-(beta-N-acetylglucosaminyl)-L-asparaginase
MAVRRIVDKNPEKAKQVQVGFLALNKQGVYGAYCLQPGFTYAVRNAENEQLLNSASHYS